MEFLYKDLQERLKDVQYAGTEVPEDERDDYEPEGDGYLTIENLNDALLINNAADTNQSGDTGISDDDDQCLPLDQTTCNEIDNDCTWDDVNNICITGGI